MSVPGPGVGGFGWWFSIKEESFYCKTILEGSKLGAIYYDDIL